MSGDRFEHRPGFIEEHKSIEFHDRPAISHRDTLATMRSHANPRNPSGNATGLRLRACPAHADHPLIFSSSNTAHAVAQAEDPFWARVARVRALVDQDPHLICLRLSTNLLLRL